METPRRSRNKCSERACLACQKRKTRCQLNPSATKCSFCTRAGQDCVFERTPTRTALTRKNFDALETRCQRLEKKVADLSAQQHFDLDQSNLDRDIPENQALPVENAQYQASGALCSGVTSSTYEWREDPNVCNSHCQGRWAADGMASLIGPRRNGYLGISSGSTLLKSILTKSTPGKCQQSDFEQLSHDCDIEASHLAPASNLTSSDIHEQLISNYFTLYNTSYPVIHERTFRKQCSNRSSIAHDSAWHIIYLMVLAIGEWAGGCEDGGQSIYYLAARTRINASVLEKGDIHLVQAFLLLANYVQKRDKPNTGYNYLGIAQRVAYGLGLHRETSSSDEDITLTHQQRRVIFWTLYNFDSGFSLTLGRPIAQSDIFFDTQKPQNVDDTNCVLTSKLPREVEHPTVYSISIAQSHLAEIANRIHSNFLALRPCPDAEHLKLILEQSLREWKDYLPAYVVTSDVPQWMLGPRAVLFWKHSNTHILLLLGSRSHQNDSYRRQRDSTKTLELSRKLIADITTFCEKHKETLHNGLVWYAVYFLLQAALSASTHRVLDLRESPSAHHTSSSAQSLCILLEECQQCLGALSAYEMTPRALRLMAVLRRDMKDFEAGQAQQRDSAPSRSSGDVGQDTLVLGNPRAGLQDNQAAEATPGYQLDDSLTTSFDPVMSPPSEWNWSSMADPSLSFLIDAFDTNIPSGFAFINR